MLEHHTVVELRITFYSHSFMIHHLFFHLLSVSGIDTVPLQFSPQLDHLAPGSAQPHKPLSRTRSEPLPQSQRALHTHLLQQQHSTQLLERLKQQTHLGIVRASKSTHSHIFREQNVMITCLVDLHIWPVCLFRKLAQICMLSSKLFV